MHFGQTLLLKGWKKEKKWILCQLFLLILAAALVTGLMQAENAADRYRREKRWDYYGQWQLIDTDPSRADYWGENRYVRQTGQIRTVGILHGAFIEDERQGIGVIEEGAADLGHLKLLSGHWPENAEEIVLEEATLQKLKLSDTPGAKITFRIGALSAEGIQSEKRVKRTYMLCGVMENYRSHWEICDTEIFPTAVIFPEEAKKLSENPRTYTLIQTEGRWALPEEDSTGTMSGREKTLVRNRYAYANAAASGRQEGGAFFCMAAGMAAALLMAVVAVLKTASRKDLWKYLYMLGTSRPMMRKLMAWEWLAMGVCGLAGGLVGGEILFLILRIGLKNSVGDLPAVGWSWQIPAAAAAAEALIILPAALISGAVLRHLMNRSEIHHRPPRHREERLSVVPGGKITPYFLVKRSFASQPAERWLMVAAAILSAAGLSGFVLFAGNVFRECRGVRQPDGAAMEVNLTTADDDYIPESGVKEEDTRVLASMLGVESLQAVTWSKARGVFRADLSEHTGEYYHAVAPYLTKKKLDQMRKLADAAGLPEPKAEEVTLTPEDVPIGVIGVNDLPAAERFLRNTSGAGWDEQAFMSGKGAILLVPDAYYYPRNEWFAPRLPASEQDYQRQLGKEYAACGDEFEVGDVLNIRYVSGGERAEEGRRQGTEGIPAAKDPGNGNASTASVRILGIVTRMRDSDCYSPLPKDAYTLVTGVNFYRNFEPWQETACYQNLRIFMNEDAGYAQTELRIRGLFGGMKGAEITDYRQDWEKALTGAWRKMQWMLLPAGILGFLLVGCAVWIWYRLRTGQMRKIRQLRSLGMGKNRLIREYRLEALLYLGISGIFSLIVLSAGVIILGLTGGDGSRWHRISSLAVCVPWFWYFAVCAGWCALYLLLYYAPLVKQCRKEEW